MQKVYPKSHVVSNRRHCCSGIEILKDLSRRTTLEGHPFGPNLTHSNPVPKARPSESKTRGNIYRRGWCGDTERHGDDYDRSECAHVELQGLVVHCAFGITSALRQLRGKIRLETNLDLECVDRQRWRKLQVIRVRIESDIGRDLLARSRRRLLRPNEMA